MSNLPQQTRDRIEKQAESYGESYHDHMFNVREYSTYNDLLSAYIAGATEWTEKAQGLIDALEWIKRYGPCDEGTLIFIDNALAKYKEVENDKTR